jgi:hypothetical protein
LGGYESRIRIDGEQSRSGVSACCRLAASSCETTSRSSSAAAPVLMARIEARVAPLSERVWPGQQGYAEVYRIRRNR